MTPGNSFTDWIEKIAFVVVVVVVVVVAVVVVMAIVKNFLIFNKTDYW